MEQKMIGKNIARIRKERGLTQAQLAEFLFVTPQTISKWEMENGTPDISLLPKIALFLDVTIDELFGISNLEHVEDLVLRYSVVRDDNLYYEAMRALENQQSTLPDGNTEEYYKLNGLKTHLLLQQSRERLKEGMAICQEMLSEIGNHYEHPWYLPFTLQMTLFEKMDGDLSGVCTKNEELFESNPNEMTLRVICETYRMLEQYDKVIEVLTKNEKATRLMVDVTPKNKSIHIAKLSALAKLNDIPQTKALAEELKKYIDVNEKFEIQMILMNLYREVKDAEAMEKAKEELLETLDELDEKDYIKELYRSQLKEIGNV